LAAPASGLPTRRLGCGREVVRVDIGPPGGAIGYLALGPARDAEGYGEREIGALHSVAELLGRSLRLHGSGGPVRR